LKFLHLAYSSNIFSQIKNIFDFWCLTPLSANISAISWRSVLVVEEAGVPGENHRPWVSNWQTLSLATASRVHPFYDIAEISLKVAF
jgi:hypothetical protein